MDLVKLKRQYLLDWVNSLDIPSCIFVNDIENLLNGNTLQEIICYIDNSFDEYDTRIEAIQLFMKEKYGYTFNISNASKEEFEDEIIALLDFLHRIHERQESQHGDDAMSQKCYDDDSNDKVQMTHNETFSIINNKEPYSIKEKERKDKGEELYYEGGQGSRLSLNNQIITGNYKLIKDTCNNPQDEFYYYKFYKPTPPIFQCDLNTKSYSKVNLTHLLIHKSTNIQLSNDSLNYTSEERRQQSEQIKERESFVIELLYDLNFIKETQKTPYYLHNHFLPNAYDGIFLANLINSLEGKKDRLITGIFKETYMKRNIVFNFKKIYNHLLHTDSFKSQYLFKNCEIYQEDPEKLFDFIYDIMSYYMKNRQVLYNKIKRYKIASNRAFERTFRNIENSQTLIPDIQETNNSLSLLNQLNASQQTILRTLRVHKEEMKINERNHEENRKSFFINTRVNTERQKLKSKMNKRDAKKDSDIIDIKFWLREIGISTQIDFDNCEMEEFKDGLLLYKIIAQLEMNQSLLPKINFKPSSPAEAVHNMRLIIKFLSLHKKSFPIAFLNQEKELYQAKPDLILEFLICLRKIYLQEKDYYDTISNKSKLSTSSFNLSKSMNNYSLKQVKTNGRDQSQRNATPLTKKIRHQFIMSPKLFWA